MEPFKNIYHLRKVADTQAKPCNFCYKPSTTVLITSDGSSDFFYTCDSHLRDKQFATPMYDDEYNKAKQQKDALDKEITALKLKWDEQNRYSGWDNLMKKFSTTKDEPKDKEKDSKDTPESKLKALNTQLSNHNEILSKPSRIYQLNNSIFKIRIDKKTKNKIQAQQTASLNSKLKDPTFFPSVPKNIP